MKKIYIVDWNSFIYRMFYAIPPFQTKTGQHVNAVFWIANFILNLTKFDKPDYLYFVRDAKWPTFRDKMFSEYKAQRDKTPDELRSQFDLVNELLESMNIPVIEITGYEADDVIWTLATNLSKSKDNDIYILSGDKDLFSLVKDNVKIFDTMKKKKYWIEETITKFGIPPEKIITYLAIVWDKADNIPGIDGFGPKKAVDCINKYWSIEELYKNVDDFSGKTKEKLIASEENALLSEKLATIVLDVNLEHLSQVDHVFDMENVLNDNSMGYLNSLEMYSLTWGEPVKSKKFDDLWISVKVIKKDSDLDKLFEKIKMEDIVAFDTETTSENALLADLVWVSFLIWEKEGYYINLDHEGDKVSNEALKNFLNNLLELEITLIAHNAKYDLEVIHRFLKWNKLSKLNQNEQKSLF